MPKIEYPAYFEDGLVGVRCTQDIQNREAFLYVPYKLVYSLNKVVEHPVLAPVIKAHPDVFHEEEGHHDWEHLTLVLGLIYEMTLGKKSFWYPYLRQMPDVEFSSSWTKEQCLMTQDEDTIA